jgi:Zn-dependent M28 family amino/carboxypeptidase
MPQAPKILQIVREIDPERIEASVRKLASFGTRHTLSVTDDPDRGIGAARNWIKSELEQYSADSGGRLKVEFQEVVIDKPTERVPRAPVSIVNVLATLPGEQPQAADRVYIVTGHYDSRVSAVNDATSFAPGANDDASGTAAIMEMARVMSKYHFDATIVFAAVAGEEQGLLGAAGLAERAKRENWRVGGMFTNDIIGNTTGGNGMHDDSRVRLFSEGVPRVEPPMLMQARQSVGGENDGPSRQLARYIKEVAERYVPRFHVTLVYRPDRFGRGGDHIPFLRQGFPAVRFTEPNENYAHQHQDVRVENGQQFGDLPEFVDFRYVAQVARVNAAAVASLASAPAPPRNVAISTQLEYDATLWWEANSEPDVARYRVLARETTAPTWQKQIDVGNVTRATLKGLSKDDYLFAVQAVDRDGNASVPVAPLPQRTTTSMNPTGSR